MPETQNQPTEKDLRQFVGREVYYSASTLIQHLLKDDSSEYYEDILAVCDRDDWEGSALAEGFRVEQRSDGDWVWYKPLDLAKSQDVYPNPELAWDGCLEDNSLGHSIDDDHSDAESVCDDTYEVVEISSGEWIWQEISDRQESEDEFDSELEAWQDCCEQNSIEPDRLEALEHWIVSNLLADKLQQHGEMVSTDIYGLTIWGRTQSGQEVFLDSVIEKIYLELQCN